MKTLSQINSILRQYNRKNYRLLFLCVFFSTLLITAYLTIMQSPMVLTVLPEGGDSRKQVLAVFALAVIGCAVFIAYTAALFLKYKSREIGIFMALGASSKQVQGTLYRDILLIAFMSGILGALAGAPFAIGIWQLFRLFIVDSSEMRFVFEPKIYLASGVFILSTLVILLVMAIRFVRQTNIIDIVNTQRKSEPVNDVKSWYGWVGILLIALGGIVGYMGPELCIRYLRWYPPAWINLLYLPLLVGIYILILFVVVHGFRGGKGRYKDIVTRSMMKFQGRQTVNNMLVVTLLIAGAYFASFYTPMLTTSIKTEVRERPVDYLFHYRQDQDMISQEEIESMADKYGVEIDSYVQAPMANLAEDGQEEVKGEKGKYHLVYREFIGEGAYISASMFTKLTGVKVVVPAGKYKAVTREDAAIQVPTERIRLTNPVTGIWMDAEFGGCVDEHMLAGKYTVLADSDYEYITQGLTEEWMENIVVFNVKDVEKSYTFAKELYKEIVGRTGEDCLIADYYDRIARQQAQERGETYFGDVEKTGRLDRTEYQSSQFREFWRYMPVFRILDQMELRTTYAVYLMLFIFIATICFAAVFVILYTRCMTLAINNRQVYEDLRHLGAGQAYLYRSVKRQIGNVFQAPVAIGTILIYCLYIMIMYMNDGGSISRGEMAGLRNSGLIVVIMTAVIWGVYRFTLKNVCRKLNI